MGAEKLIVPPVPVLKSLLAQLGLSRTGSKADLVSRLTNGLRHGQSSLLRSSKSTRILSIDMGIRNLAFCVADVIPTSPSKESSLPSYEMKIAAWRRFDVGEEVARLASEQAPGEAGAGGAREPWHETPPDPYEPPVLSKTAYALLTKTLLPYRPDIILIERQRWRTNSNAAVQQWTIRVNLLEGILYATLNTLRSEAQRHMPGNSMGEQRANMNFETKGIEPKRVNYYWVGLEEGVNTSGRLPDTRISNLHTRLGLSTNRGKAMKQAKIALVQSWLTTLSNQSAPSKDDASDEPMSSTERTPISFSFTHDAEPTRTALSNASNGERRKAGEPEKMKLDDVADCFLQAAAWVAWEGNRLRLTEVLGDVLETEEPYSQRRENERPKKPKEGTNATIRRRTGRQSKQPATTGNEEDTAEKTQKRRRGRPSKAA